MEKERDEALQKVEQAAKDDNDSKNNALARIAELEQDEMSEALQKVEQAAKDDAEAQAALTRIAELEKERDEALQKIEQAAKDTNTITTRAGTEKDET